MKDIIKYKELSNYIKSKLKRIDTNFNDKDLLLVDELKLDYNIESVDLNILSKFKNIKKLTLKNYSLDKDSFYILILLSKLESITFERCFFDNHNIIAGFNLKTLKLVNCYINNYDFIYVMDKLTSLEVINGTIEITKLNRLNNLEFLVLNNSKILDPNHNIIIDSLKDIHIDNTNITDISILNNLKNLEYISLDEKQIDNNKDLIKSFIKRNIHVYEESMIEIGDEDEI